MEVVKSPGLEIFKKTVDVALSWHGLEWSQVRVDGWTWKSFCLSNLYDSVIIKIGNQSILLEFQNSNSFVLFFFCSWTLLLMLWRHLLQSLHCLIYTQSFEGPPHFYLSSQDEVWTIHSLSGKLKVTLAHPPECLFTSIYWLSSFVFLRLKND